MYRRVPKWSAGFRNGPELSELVRSFRNSPERSEKFRSFRKFPELPEATGASEKNRKNGQTTGVHRIGTGKNISVGLCIFNRNAPECTGMYRRPTDIHRRPPKKISSVCVPSTMNKGTFFFCLSF